MITVVYGQDCKHEKLLEKQIKTQSCMVLKYVYITGHIWSLAVRQHLYHGIATPEVFLYNLRTSYKKRHVVRHMKDVLEVSINWIVLAIYSQLHFFKDI